MSDAGPARYAVAAAPGVFVLLWSTGFVGAEYGLPYAEPFTILGWRLLAAAVLLIALAAALRTPLRLARGHVGRSAVSGVLLHAGYLGGVFAGIARGVSPSVAAVVVSLQPVLVAALSGLVLGERLRALQWVGTVAGLAGVVLVLGPALVDAGRAADPPAGLAACGLALLCGTLGTLHHKRHGDAIPLLAGTAVQYLAASAVLLLLAVSTETMAIEWTARFVAAFGWMVVVLSCGAVLLLLWLLRRGSAAGVSSLYYLVPPATAVEAFLLFGERLAPVSLVGIAVTTVGVALALRAP